MELARRRCTSHCRRPPASSWSPRTRQQQCTLTVRCSPRKLASSSRKVIKTLCNQPLGVLWWMSCWIDRSFWSISCTAYEELIGETILVDAFWWWLRHIWNWKATLFDSFFIVCWFFALPWKGQTYKFWMGLWYHLTGGAWLLCT